MRIPRTHDLTLAYCERFGLPLDAVHRWATRRPTSTSAAGGGGWPRSRPIPAASRSRWRDGERGRSVDALWARGNRGRSGTGSRATGDAAWAAIVREWDHCSTREFLEHCGWSEGAIEAFGLLQFQEALMNSSFLELLREEVTRCYVDLVEIAGGMDRLPRAFLPGLRPRIRFGARMIALDQDERSATVHYQTPAGRFRETGDHVLVTVPVRRPAARRDAEAVLAREAARHPAAPLRRLGEDPLPVPPALLGGGRRASAAAGTVTDLPIRALYYPDHGRETGPRRPAGELHVVGGRAALGLARAGRPDRPGARERRRSSTRR